MEKIPTPEFLDKLENEIIPWLASIIKKEEKHVAWVKENDPTGKLVNVERRSVVYYNKFREYNEYLAKHKYSFNHFSTLKFTLSYGGEFNIQKIISFFKQKYQLFAIVLPFGAEVDYSRYVYEIRNLKDHMSGVNCQLEILNMEYEEMFEKSFVNEQDAWIAAIGEMINMLKEDEL